MCPRANDARSSEDAVDRQGLLRFVFVMLLAVGCGEAVTEPPPSARARPATMAELLGPWRQTPLVLDAAIRARVERVCRTDMERLPGSVAAVTDARGEGVVTVRMTGVSAGTCDALQITRDGQVTGAGGGQTQGGVDVEKLAPIGQFELSGLERTTVGGGSLTTEGLSLFGRAGGGIASVVVQPGDHAAVLATVENGWFAAWWPKQGIMDQMGRPELWPPFVVRGYDAAGILVDEISEAP
jgi:hypothetical protein